MPHAHHITWFTPWRPPHRDAETTLIICNLTNYLHTHLGCALDDNVQKQQGKQLSTDWFTVCCLLLTIPSIVTTALWHHWLCHPPPTSTTSDRPGVFNTLTARGRRDMRVRHCFIYMFCLLIWSYLDMFWIRVSWLDPSHLPHQPPILSTTPLLKSNHLRGDSAVI